MKAMIYAKYGSPDVLELREVQKPTPQDNQVLIKVHAASLNAADSFILRGNPWMLRLVYGLLKPKNPILGSDVAGVIEAIGPKVTKFKVGDAVFGDLAAQGLGGFAEYVCAEQNSIALKPEHLSFETMAAVPMAGFTALSGLRDFAKIKAGQQVLIYGASGGVGTFAVQLAKYYGAKVTAVCSSSKVEMIRSIGADHVIDYHIEDFAQQGVLYDLILAANGNRSIFDYQRALQPNGTYVMTGGSMKQIFQAMLLGPVLSLLGKQKLGNSMAKSNQETLMFLQGLVATGQIKPVIDRQYPLHDLANAIKYLEVGHARGKVIINVA